MLNSSHDDKDVDEELLKRRSSAIAIRERDFSKLTLGKLDWQTLLHACMLFILQLQFSHYKVAYT